jgi:hypothetical protein
MEVTHFTINSIPLALDSQLAEVAASQPGDVKRGRWGGGVNASSSSFALAFLPTYLTVFQNLG